MNNETEELRVRFYLFGNFDNVNRNIFSECVFKSTQQQIFLEKKISKESRKWITVLCWSQEAAKSMKAKLADRTYEEEDDEEMRWIQFLNHFS